MTVAGPLAKLQKNARVTRRSCHISLRRDSEEHWRCPLRRLCRLWQVNDSSHAEQRKVLCWLSLKWIRVRCQVDKVNFREAFRLCTVRASTRPSLNFVGATNPNIASIVCCLLNSLNYRLFLCIVVYWFSFSLEHCSWAWLSAWLYLWINLTWSQSVWSGPWNPKDWKKM